MEPQVGAAKGDDPGIKTGARRRGEAVGPSARAEDRVPGPRLAAFVAQSHASPSESDRVDRAARRDGRAGGGDVRGEPAGDRGEIDDCRAWGVKRREPARVGLDLARARGVEEAQSLD